MPVTPPLSTSDQRLAALRFGKVWLRKLPRVGTCYWAAIAISKRSYCEREANFAAGNTWSRWRIGREFKPRLRVCWTGRLRLVRMELCHVLHTSWELDCSA